MDRTAATGPRRPEWGYEHETATLHSILDDLLEFPDEFWAAGVDDRFTAMSTIADELTKTVIAHWPDTDSLAARVCPDTILKESTLAQGRAKQRFGELDVNVGLSKRIMDWRKGAEICQEELPAGVAERVCRLLLHEHIRRCANEMTSMETYRRWKEAQAIAQETMDQVALHLRETLAWCNIDSIDLSSASQTISYFIRNWSDGAPAWEGSLNRYVQFLNDCLRYRLLCTPPSNSLAAATWRSWRCVLNPMRKSVFVSYSTRNTGKAERLALALRDRALKVGLDRWEITPNFEERSVQRWIAESIMSSEARVILLSAEALKSGWVQLEIEWDRRLLGARRMFALPYLVLLDDRLPLSLEGYPPARVIPVSLLDRDAGCVADELALRIVLEWLSYLRSVK
jgi:TIR domain